MTTTFPTTIDALVNPLPTDPRTNPSHAGQHQNENDAIEALEAKVGVNGSAVATSLDKKVADLQAATTVATHAAAADPHAVYVQESLFDAKGDLISASADNTPVKVTAGANDTVLMADSAQAAGLKWVTLFQSIDFSKGGALAVGAGTFRWYNRSGRTLTFDSVTASVGTAPTGASIIVDVNKGGTTIYSTQGNRPTIAVSTFTHDDTTAPNVTTIADNEYLTVDIDQVGSTVAGADLTVQVWLRG